MADIEVELQGGIKVMMPEEKATIYKEARSKDKDQRELLAAKVATAERDKAAADAAKAETERAAAIEKANKEGDIKKVRELAEEESLAKLKRREKTVIREHLRATATRLFPKVDSVIIDDTIGANVDRFRLNPETDAIEVIDGAGQLLSDPKTRLPMTADAVLMEFAKPRPHLQVQKAPPGDGKGLGRGRDAESTHSITFTEQQKLMRDGKWVGSEFEHAQKARKLEVVDDT